MFEEEGYYFVTSRCFQGRLLLRPGMELNEVVGGVLARALQQSHGAVKLYGFTFASNHFHLLLWARGASLASFMQHLRANLSKKVGRMVDWSGSFWERRYSAEPVLDDSALVDRLRYLLAHGVKEGLVERCAQWPGLSCLPQLVGPTRRLFPWFDWTKRWRARRTVDMSGEQGRYDGEWAEWLPLELAVLPCWEALDEEQRRREVQGLIELVEAQAREQGKVPLGERAVREQHPHTRPAHLKRSPRPLGHGKRSADHTFPGAESLFSVESQEVSRWDTTQEQWAPHWRGQRQAATGRSARHRRCSRRTRPVGCRWRSSLGGTG
jgi:hypothetical protein